ncbi:hypothetical protein BJ165DRAFT_1510022 [Panaeolus papilionaceus]|nr:hypothetical protein BJ165DRAFT_1510022 [Panaeolus papilionaceus]
MIDHTTTQSGVPTTPSLQMLPGLVLPCKSIGLLGKYKLTLLVKLRINHLPTNAYLRSKRLAQSSDCEKCGTGAKETVNHFIHDCRAYTLQRHRLYDKIKDNERNLKKILIDEDSTLALLEYIEDTKRFPKKSFQIIDRPTNQQST